MKGRKDMSTLKGLGSLAMRSYMSRNEGRVAWLMDRLAERKKRRTIAVLVEELLNGPSGPGQIELAIAELSIHPDPNGQLALKLWTPLERDHVELRAACLGEEC